MKRPPLDYDTEILCRKAMTQAERLGIPGTIIRSQGEREVLAFTLRALVARVKADNQE